MTGGFEKREASGWVERWWTEPECLVLGAASWEDGIRCWRLLGVEWPGDGKNVKSRFEGTDGEAAMSGGG